MSTIEFDIIEVEDIMTFIDENTKGNNDSTNRTREKIIANILSPSPDYLTDPIYGQHWINIHDKLRDALHSLCNIHYHQILIKQKGGMTFNYDFVVQYCDEQNQVVHSVNLEFKNNASSIKELVQFLELYDKDCKTKFELFDYSYSEFYYDHYLDAYLALDFEETEENKIEKPSKETYLKHIHDIKYKHPFFNKIYTNKTKKKKEKDKLVEESRKKFIETYASTFNFEKIKNKIVESQSNKIFMLWDKNNFLIQTIDVENIHISGIKSNGIHDLYFDVTVENFIYDIRIRLNWGNNNGVANPRWKFTFINK
jgi:hypothetical protein